jgi:hypothetical protein
MLGFWIILAHLIGDYVLQSQWMAAKKTEDWWPAIVHGITYTIPYAFITQSWRALALIAISHILIDHYRVAKQVCWFKNLIAPWYMRPSWWEAKDNNGYPAKVPVWMSTWLMIVTDNSMHLLINAMAVLYL